MKDEDGEFMFLDKKRYKKTRHLIYKFRKSVKVGGEDEYSWGGEESGQIFSWG